MINEKTSKEIGVKLQKNQLDKTKKVEPKNQQKNQQKISKKKNLSDALRKNLVRRKIGEQITDLSQI